MSFFSLDKDERDDWRKQPVTQMALAELAKMRAQLESDALGDVRAGEDNHARLTTGKADGIGEAIELLTREESE